MGSVHHKLLLEVSVDAKGDTYRSGFRFLGLPQGDIGGNGGGLGRAHGRFGPGGDDAHWVRGHCLRDRMGHCCLHISRHTALLG